MDDDTPLPTPAPPPSPLSKEPTELQKLRFDYAWKWFNFHAEQRTKMFNFMLVGLGILATALVGAIEKKLLLEAAVVGTAATMVALVFSLLDARNRQLYIAAMDVLIDAEKNLVFGDGVKFKDHNGQDKDFGISRRIALEEGADKSTWNDNGIDSPDSKLTPMPPATAAPPASLWPSARAATPAPTSARPIHIAAQCRVCIRAVPSSVTPSDDPDAGTLTATADAGVAGAGAIHWQQTCADASGGLPTLSK